MEDKRFVDYIFTRLEYLEKENQRLKLVEERLNDLMSYSHTIFNYGTDTIDFQIRPIPMDCKLGRELKKEHNAERGINSED